MEEFDSVVSEFFEWGAIGTIIRTVASYNVNTSRPDVSEDEYPVQVIVFDYVSKSEGDTTKNNTLVRTGDKQVFVRPSATLTEINPTTDILRLGNKRYKIVTKKEVNPNLSHVYYFELYVRA